MKQMEYGVVRFPTVTICNANPWKASKAFGTPLQELVSIFLMLGEGVVEGIFRQNFSKWVFLQLDT